MPMPRPLDLQNLAWNCRMLRLARRWSQHELAARWGTSQMVVSFVETGGRFNRRRERYVTPRMGDIAGLARALGVSQKQLLQPQPLLKVKLKPLPPRPSATVTPATDPSAGQPASAA